MHDYWEPRIVADTTRSFGFLKNLEEDLWRNRGRVSAFRTSAEIPSASSSEVFALFNLETVQPTAASRAAICRSSPIARSLSAFERGIGTLPARNCTCARPQKTQRVRALPRIPVGAGCSIFPSMRITPSRRGRGSTLREKFGYTPTTGFRPRGRGVGASEAERACKGNPVKSTELIAVGQSMTGYRFRFCRFFSRFVLLDFLTRGTLDCGPDEASLSFPLRRPDPPS